MTRDTTIKQAFQYHLGVTLMLVQGLIDGNEDFYKNRVLLPVDTIRELCNTSIRRVGEKKLSNDEVKALLQNSKQLVSQYDGLVIQGDEMKAYLELFGDYSTESESDDL